MAFSAESRAEAMPTSYYDGVGFHLYSQLSLQLKYTALQNTAAAAKSLEIIQRYTDLADACAQKSGGRILEVQGECLHLFFEKELTKVTLSEMLVFCTELTNAVYDQKQHLGGDAFEGFKIAFDHGRALILSTGTAADDLFVSLGPCANRPAKHLPVVPAEATSMPSEIAALLFTVDGRSNWYTMKLTGHDALALSATESWSSRNFSATANRVVQRVYDPATFFVGTNHIAKDSRFRFTSADLQQGFFMRADLHDFTRKVKDAFDSGSEREILSLLANFYNVLKYGEDFLAQTPRPAIRLPWAGDCANMLLLPKTNESLDDSQLYYSATGPADWLSGYNGEIHPPFEEAKWLVSICCGDEKNGKRNVLIAKVSTSEHDFLFATGWSVGRSKDAHEVENVRAGDALTSDIDYRVLEDEYQEYFIAANSVFMKSGALAGLASTGKSYVPTLQAKASTIPGIAIQTPPSRPYWCEKH